MKPQLPNVMTNMHEYNKLKNVKNKINPQRICLNN